jgi:rSAM/selenodomain-associated transferase 2
MSVISEFAVSVVIPTLNEEHAIGECLRSVGVIEGVEVVVSDGGSTDRTLEIVKAHVDTVVVSGSPGRGQQLNRGAAAAQGRLLLFPHADCRLPKGWLGAMEAALADPETALCCFWLRTTPSDNGPNNGWRSGWLRLLDLRSRGLGLPYGDQGFGLRRETFVTLGGFPNIPLMEDVVLARECRKMGSIHRIPLEIETTARRFERRPIATRVMMATFPSLFRLGVSPWRLAEWYRHVR